MESGATFEPFRHLLSCLSPKVPDIEIKPWVPSMKGPSKIHASAKGVFMESGPLMGALKLRDISRAEAVFFRDLMLVVTIKEKIIQSSV